MKRVRSSLSKKHVAPPLGSEVQVESLRSRLQSLLRSGTRLLSPVSLRSPTPVRLSAICKPFAKKRRLVIRSLTMRPSPVLPPPCVQDTAAQLSGPMHSQSVTVSVSIVASIQTGDTVMPEEPNSEASEKAATEARIATAVDFTNRAVKCMVANDKKEIESLITDLHKWQPCAVSLRKSGLPLILYDVKVWEDAKVYDEASELRTKFSSIMKSDRKNKSADLTAPFNSMSPLQFRQTVNKREAFVQEGHIMEAKKGLYKKLAYHLVMNNFTVPQSLEGLKVESCKAFAKSFHDVTALSRAIANGTAIAADARSRLMMAV